MPQLDPPSGIVAFRAAFKQPYHDVYTLYLYMFSIADTPGLQCADLRSKLVALSEHPSHPFDFYLRLKAEFYTKYKLACFVSVPSSDQQFFSLCDLQDMDSCILGNECIDEMATVFGKGEQVSEITRR